MGRRRNFRSIFGQPKTTSAEAMQREAAIDPETGGVDTGWGDFAYGPHSVEIPRDQRCALCLRPPTVYVYADGMRENGSFYCDEHNPGKVFPDTVIERIATRRTAESDTDEWYGGDFDEAIETERAIRDESDAEGDDEEDEMDLDKREAQLLQALAKATMAEAPKVMAELNEVRQLRQAAIAAERSVDLSGAVVKSHLTPVLAHSFGLGKDTDWLANIQTTASLDVEQAMTVEATLWFNKLDPAVHADREEFRIQAEGVAHVQASQFGQDAHRAARAFLDHVAHLQRVASMSRTAADLYDYTTGERIGPATEAQIEASENGDPDTGAFQIDDDGNPVPVGGFGATRTVYVATRRTAAEGGSDQGVSDSGVAESGLPVERSPETDPEVFDNFEPPIAPENEAAHAEAEGDGTEEAMQAQGARRVANDDFWASRCGATTGAHIGNQTPMEVRCTKPKGHEGLHEGTTLDSDDNPIRYTFRDDQRTASRRTAAIEVDFDDMVAVIDGEAVGITGWDDDELGQVARVTLRDGRTLVFEQDDFGPLFQGTWRLASRRTAATDWGDGSYGIYEAFLPGGVIARVFDAANLMSSLRADFDRRYSGAAYAWEVTESPNVRAKGTADTLEEAKSAALAAAQQYTASRREAKAPQMKRRYEGPDKTLFQLELDHDRKQKKSDDKKRKKRIQENKERKQQGKAPKLRNRDDQGRFASVDEAVRYVRANLSEANRRTFDALPPQRRVAVAMQLVREAVEAGEFADESGAAVSGLPQVEVMDALDELAPWEIDELDGKIIGEGARRQAEFRAVVQASLQREANAAQDACPQCRAEPGYHADLHAGHIWTNTSCPAYKTLDGSDCTCGGKTAARSRHPFVREAMPNPADLGVGVGDIFYASWGYDQTNVNWYQVVGLTGASVKVRPIRGKYVEQRGPGGNSVVPDPGTFHDRDVLIGFGTSEATKRIQTGYRGTPGFRVGDHWASKWDGQPMYETDSQFGH